LMVKTQGLSDIITGPNYSNITATSGAKKWWLFTVATLIKPNILMI